MCDQLCTFTLVYPTALGKVNKLMWQSPHYCRRKLKLSFNRIKVCVHYCAQICSYLQIFAYFSIKIPWRDDISRNRRKISFQKPFQALKTCSYRRLVLLQALTLGKYLPPENKLCELCLGQYFPFKIKYFISG